MAMGGFLLADKAGWDDLGVIPDQNIAWIKVIDDIEKLLVLDVLMFAIDDH